MTSTINFHIHTTYSDGSSTPAEVVAMLKKEGVTTFAITDHDTAEGNLEAAACAKECGLTHINGIELSCCFSDGEIGLDESWTVHILGLGINLELMKDKLEALENEKQERLHELFNSLVADGYNIELKKIAQKGKIPARKTIARALVNNAYASNADECYEKILNSERYRPFAKNKPSIKEGIEIIQACGGLAVWAHPFGVTRGGKKKLDQEQVYALLQKMREYGIEGMEVYYQKYTQEQISWLNFLAETFKLYKSVGTDLHNSPFEPPKRPEYAESRKLERFAFDIVEPDAGVEALVKKILKIGEHDHEDEVSYPNKNVYTYKKYQFKCKKCSWEGLGAETIDLTDVINFCGANCPKCHSLIEFISYPSNKEVLRFGTAKDKKKAEGWIKEEERMKKEWDRQRKEYPPLNSPDQLPEIDEDEIIISLREEGEKSGIYKHEFIVLYWGKQEIWREHTYFEYYTAYLRMGKILKEKYGERLVDFEAEHTVDLGGDSSFAFDKVDNFRKTLKRKEL